ncbi:MAG: ubiquinone biosynthesis protein COQ4 [Kiritimatiellia bacterium]|jgi:ubiquinone biosynthesis protein COQ4
MLSPIRLASAAYHALRLYLRPGHLPSIFGLVGALNTPAQLAAMRAHLSAHPRAAAALAAPFHLNINVQALAALPAGTLGRTFADFVVSQHIEPRVLTDMALGETDWIPVHLYEVHDIWHVLTGIETDVVSEVQILAFMLAQLPRTTMAPLAIGVAIVRGALGHPDLDPLTVQRAIARGTQQGEQAELLFGINWAERWHRPLCDLQSELRLRDVRNSVGEPRAIARKLSDESKHFEHVGVAPACS